jgi:hypothetical protein
VAEKVCRDLATKGSILLWQNWKKAANLLMLKKVHCCTGYLFCGADVLIRDLGIDNWLDIGTSARTPVPMCVWHVLPDKKKHVND